MDKEIIIKKIQALLHDPPEKALILGKNGHEERASYLMKIIETSAIITEQTKDADHIASASDRINFPKSIEARVDFSREPVIVHPLSGKEFRIPASATSAISGIDYKQVMNNVDDALKEIASKYPDLELRYLSLWAELQGIIRDKECGNSSLGQLWELLPADTRIPDHSIWEHRRVTSAIAGALPGPSLLLFSIGPIQDFIATARKTQDLWTGSYMLSHISWTAMKAISEEMGPDSIIFPDLTEQPFCNLWLKEKGLEFIGNPNKDALSSPTLPNRVLAILPKNQAEDIAKKAENAVKAGFKEVCVSVREKIEETVDGLKSDRVWDSIWDRQTKDFMEVYRAILPMGKKNGYTIFIETYKTFLGEELLKDFERLLNEYETRGFGPNIGTVYGQLYRFLEKGHGTRKTIRDFFQQSEPHYKCTMCGVREPVHPEKHNNQSCEKYGALVGFWKERMRKNLTDIKASERLCAVCVTKRFARYYFNDKLRFKINTSYPSTSTMATSAFKLRIIENKELNDLLVKAHLYTQKVIALAGDTVLGGTPPMILGACKGDKLCEDFARLEGDWLYEDSLDEEVLWEEYKNGFKDKKEFNQILEPARDAFKEFIRLVKKKEKDLRINLGTPSKYYAIIQMDGDHMGKWLSGENAPKIENILHPEIRSVLYQEGNWKDLIEQKRPLNPSLHIGTSKALRDFSLKVVREIIERDHLGRLIYAGGDDVLAFVSLRDLIKVMRCLRAYFSGALTTRNGRIEVDFREGSGFIPMDMVDNQIRPLSVGSRENEIKGFLCSMGTKAEASMGVAIVHHSYDLAKALQEARDTEKKAKNEVGRNAFCISLNKRSGGAEVFGAKWYYKNDEYFETIPVVEKLIEAFSDNTWLSPRFAYDFRAEILGLQGLTVNHAIEFELRRIALRHTQDKERHSEDSKELVSVLISLKENIENELSKQNDSELQKKKNEIALEELSKLLNITTFLARRENQ